LFCSLHHLHPVNELLSATSLPPFGYPSTMTQIPAAQLDLGYPPWCLEFDPYDRDYLVVGGGGGGGQKEVPNRLSLVDVSSSSELFKVAEVEVSDDSPASLGLLATKDGLYSFAGANSSSADQKAGTNEHFRSFKFTFPELPKDPKKKSKPGKIEPLGKTTLFSESYLKSSDAFQRILRLSPADKTGTGNKRIAAVGSSLSTPSEILFLDATTATPTTKDVFHRIEPPSNAEPNDIDLYKVADGEFLYAYCTNREIYLGHLSYDFRNRQLKSKPTAASCVYSVPLASSGPRTKYRSLRFLSDRHLLVLVNKGSVSELLLFRIFPEDSVDNRGDIILQKNLPPRFGAAVALDVSVLDSNQSTGEYQVVIAIAAQARDLAILTMEMPAKGAPTSFGLYRDVPEVHEAPMKKIALSSFVSPYVPNSRFKRRAGPFHIRVASISLSNTVVVHSLELQTIGYTSRKPRHVLKTSFSIGEFLKSGTNLFVLAFLLLAALVLTQSILDSRTPDGSVASVRVLPSKVHSFITRARQDNDPIKHIIHEVTEGHVPKPHSLLDLVKQHHREDQKHIVISPSDLEGGNAELVTEVHHDDALLVADPKAMKWDELSKQQQEAWKQRLVNAGQWTASQGDTILKSIFFSEVGGAWGQAAMQAIVGGG
jgi:prolactin regulatory element-binding protein